MTTYTINFEPVGRRGECPKDEPLLACARRLGVGISSICGGKGTCHSCRVQILSGNVSPPTPNEIETFSPQELKAGWRLACQTYPAGDVKITVPPESMTTPQRLQVEGWEVKVRPEPPVKVYHLKLTPPSLSSAQADADRLIGALDEQYQLKCTGVDIGALRLAPAQLRSWGWECQAVVRDKELIALIPPLSRPLGLAIDLGTTKIAGYLIDMSDGKTLAAKGMMNPQISYGEDIISRMAAVVKAAGSAVALQRAAVEAITELGAELCNEANARAEEIVEAVVVGNTAMHHLFLRLPVSQLALSPFVPAVSRVVEIKAAELGLGIAPGAYVHLLPNIAGFVGADHVAVLLATQVAQAKGAVVIIDIGTNTEVSLLYNGKLTATSCASGPAFEGGHIKYGMRAVVGAIERIRISGESVQYQTIGEAPPVGICGSGILDGLSQLYLARVIDEGGRITGKHPRIRTNNEQREFVLVGEKERGAQSAITITQPDIRELQLAKAAIRTGIQTLLEVANCPEQKIGQVVIAGAFGTYIDVASAVSVGMLPPLPLDRFQQVGNAAGMGAKLALISLKSRSEAQAIAARVSYIELASAPNFHQNFVQTSYLGRYRIRDGKREVVD